MMKVHSNFSLINHNTFGIEAFARFFAAPASIDELIALLKDPKFIIEKKLILGGGSNMLFINNFGGLVIHLQMKGKQIITEKDNALIIKALAGENWDEFVEWTVNQNLYGLENLSLIPGTVGACPIQNIGAYGVEVGECIERVEAIDIQSLEIKEFKNNECQFAYRNSIFKNELKNQYIITAVYFKLSKSEILKTHYGAVAEELNKAGGCSLKAIRKAIINIRESKLPNPEQIPNAGSFFKNPIVTRDIAEKLINQFPKISYYEAENNQIKLAAGWMIDYLGWKGKNFGGAAVHEKQALVLINKSKSNGVEVLNLANKIVENVFEVFGVKLEMEVNIIS